MMYEVLLDIRNPLKIRDGKSVTHGICHLVDMLHYTLKVISSEERDRCYRAGCVTQGATTSEMIAILEARGFDGFVYKNCIEDPGSQSWVVFRPDQVTVQRVCIEPSV